MYKSIRIQNFRGIKDLEINDLGRVNLIVGANNVGKSSVLEALSLLHMHRDGYELGTILRSRGYEPGTATDGAFSTMLYGRDSKYFEISGLHQELNQRNHVVGSQQFGDFVDRTSAELWKYAKVSDQEFLQLYFVGQRKNEYEKPQEMIDLKLETGRPFPSDAVNGPWGSVSYLPSNGTYSNSNLARILTQIERLGATDQIVSTLQRFDDRIVDVFNGLDMIDVTQTTVNVTVKLDGGTKMGLPLGAIGGGTKRLFEMLLLLPLAGDGVALIDDIDQGIFHGNLPNLWDAVAHAMPLGRRPQILATTHSWECVTAAVDAFKLNPRDFRLHRLERRDGVLSVVTATTSQVAGAAEFGMEVR